MFKKTIIIFYGLFSEEQSYDWIPYIPLFVHARLRAAGFFPVLIHEFKDRNYQEIIRKYGKETLLFGVSAMSGYQIKSSIRAIECFRKQADPKTPIIWGGAHPTAMPHNTLNSKYADYVCVGHAKDNFVNFVKTLQKERIKESNFPDILTLDDFSTTKSERYCVKDYQYDLSAFPPLAFDEFDFSYLLTENRVLNYVGSIGCPGNCSFCTWGGKHPWSAMPPKRVLDDLEYLVNRYNLRSIWLADADLTVNKNYLLGLAQGLIDRKINIYWRCHARAMELAQYKKNDYALLEASGLDRFFIGIENVDLEIQKLYGKIIIPDIVYEAMAEAKDFDIQMKMSFIFGNPGGPLNDLEKNREFLSKCQRLNPNMKFQVCFYTPYPGCAMADLAESKGYNPPTSLEGYGDDPYFLDTNRSQKNRIFWYTADESDDYNSRYLKLFPKTDCLPEWGWRDKKKKH